MIELLDEQGSRSTTPLCHRRRLQKRACKKSPAQTTNDLIQYETEHGPFEPQRLRDFHAGGLVDGGSDTSGHRTLTTVIVTLPFPGLTPPPFARIRGRSNRYSRRRCARPHAAPRAKREAVRAFVAAVTRYPFDRRWSFKGADSGRRKGCVDPAVRPAGRIGGISATEHMERADPRPMNPKGELILSVKMEDKHALENVDQITGVPGIAWGRMGSFRRSVHAATHGSRIPEESCGLTRRTRAPAA